MTLYNIETHGAHNASTYRRVVNKLGLRKMDIIERIQQCAIEHQISTGTKPTRIYLGRTEISLIKLWAHMSQYAVTLKESEHRYKVLGMTIYEVNDDEPHMVVMTNGFDL